LYTSQRIINYLSGIFATAILRWL